MSTQPALVATPDVFEKTRNHGRTEQLKAAREADLMPYFREISSATDPVVEMQGKSRIMLGSNNYLGLTNDPRVKQGAQDALERYGTALTGSRFLNGTIDLHVQLEEEIAEWLGEEDALVFTTGYQANLGCLATLLGEQDTVIADSANHASLVDGCRLSRARIERFDHNRSEHLEQLLKETQDQGRGVLVLVDGVFSMEGDVAPLTRIVELCRRYDARLMVDEAHAIGVLGARGTGASELLGVANEVDLRMGTFSKSLASCGGFIAGPADVVDYLRIHSRTFIFTAAGVPAAVGAALAALRICRSAEGPQLFAQVLDNARYLRSGLEQLGFKVSKSSELDNGEEVLTPIVPMTVGDDWKAVLFWKALYDRGVYTNTALYPAVPAEGAMLRASVMANHSREQLDQALTTFAEVRSRFEAEHGPLP